MPIIIDKFDVNAEKHPNADDTNLEWKVLVKVRFASEDPKEWGEFRAFGGGWRRSIQWRGNPPNESGYRVLARVKDKVKVSEETTSQIVAPVDIDIEDCDLQATSNSLPFWGHAAKPSDLRLKSLRLGNDQHIEIFYRQEVPGVARSIRKNYDDSKRAKATRFQVFDPLFDENPSDMETLKAQRRPLELPKGVQRISYPSDIKFDEENWHIIARDEPGWSGVAKDAFVEYWHQAEFQVRQPNSLQVIEKKRFFLRVSGWGATSVRAKDQPRVYTKLPM